MSEKTKICCLDVDKDIVKFMGEDHEFYFGTMGYKVSMPAHRSSSVPVQPTYTYPSNIHEYDVFIVDMANTKVEEYFKEDYISLNNEISDVPYIACPYSVALFNPIPYGAYAFRKHIQTKKDRKPIIIVFQDKEVRITYNWYSNRRGYKEETHSNYDFIPSPYLYNLDGCQARLVDNNVSEYLFKNRLEDVRFHCVFDCHEQSSYVPLLINRNGECISYVYDGTDALVIMLPQMNDKAGCLKMLFEDFLYEFYSDYFPSIEEKRWIRNAEYMLPNEEKLYAELEDTRKEYEEKQKEIEKRIEENAGNYSFLQILITGTGDELVDAMIKYLNWMGFENVEKADDDGEELKEEDIRISIPDGLFMLEVKGIKHNSTDDECRQIGKYKARRLEDSDMKKIKALYVVNHQRNIEPLKRKNPPFEPQQIKDASYERRGILTTWQLYNLYYDIEKGVIAKDEAREEMMQYGLVTFSPQRVVEIGKPTRYFKGNVICVDLEGQRVSVGDEVFVSDGRNWHKAEVLSMEINNQRYDVLDKGDVGMKLSEDLPHNKVVYVRHKEI